MSAAAKPSDVFAGCVLVPTMGALHDGHVSLIRHAAEIAAPDTRPVVVTVFVNPTQFAPGEDLDRYPRQLEHDTGLAADAGATMVFSPSVETVYPPGETLDTPGLPAVAVSPGLEDAHRPGHFGGVVEVVARLFDMTRPRYAVFGEKDYQQLLVIRAMVEQAAPRWSDLEIVARETIREPDGLAMSSRNVYLSAGDRDRALALSRALAEAQAMAQRRAGAADIEGAMRRMLTDADLDMDYAVERDAATLGPSDTTTSARGDSRAIIAARLGDVRLIDNAPI